MEYLSNPKYFESMGFDSIEFDADEYEAELSKPKTGEKSDKSLGIIAGTSSTLPLRDFILSENPTLDPKFIDEFVICLDGVEGCVIDLDKAMKWIGFSRKDNIKVILKKNFCEGTDYKVSKTQNKFGKRDVLLSVDCFKDLSQQAPSEKGKVVREYYRKMEKSYIKYIKNQAANAEKRIVDLKQENEIVVKKLSKFVYQPLDKIYILEDLSLDDLCQESGERYYKIGKATDIKQRERSYHTGRTQKVQFLYEKECVDCRFVESMIKRILRGYEYEAGREIYGIKLENLKNIVKSCCDFLELMLKYNEDTILGNTTVILPEFDYKRLAKQEKIKMICQNVDPFPWMTSSRLHKF